MRRSLSARIQRRVFREFSDRLDRLGISFMPTMTSRYKVSGFRIQWRRDEPDTVRLVLVNTVIGGQPVRFLVSNEIDEVQREHRQGKFYEEEELAIIGRYFRGGTFVDVGANVGNHSLYALLSLNAAKVIAFEPIPLTHTILQMNIAANGLQDRVTLHQVGLSDSEARVSFASPKYNLGATRLIDGDTGAIEIRRGDDVLESEPVDFIKIDTEGFEIKVLHGLRRTIEKNRPVLFVELEEANLPAYDAFCRDLGYRTVETFQRYPYVLNRLSVFDRQEGGAA